MAVLRKVSDERHKPLREANADVPPWLATIVNRLLSKNPSKRPQTAAEVADLLEKRLAKLRNPAANLETIKLKPRPAFVRFVAARPLRIAAVVALAIGLIFASDAFGVTHVGDLVATILRIKTVNGTLVLQVDDPDVKVALDGKDVVISEPGVREVRLRPGLHQLRTAKGDAPEQVELVTIARGGKQTVRVGLETSRPAQSAESKDPGRPLSKQS